MKYIKLVLTEAEFRRMKKARRETTYTSWETFVVAKCCNGVSEKRTYSPFKGKLKRIVGEGLNHSFLPLQFIINRRIKWKR